MYELIHTKYILVTKGFDFKPEIALSFVIYEFIYAMFDSRKYLRIYNRTSITRTI